MNIAFLSKYRAQLMGVAMLMVVFHHLPFDINNVVYHYLKQNAGFGVDIFLLLSGIGLYFSISKNNVSLTDYYKHRFVRIFPIYALIILCVSIIKGNYDILDFILKVTTIGWWFNGTCFDWFIPTIVMLYAVFPLFYHVILKRNNIMGGQITVVIMYLSIVLFVPYGSDFQMILRFPVFFLGALLGKIIKENEKMCLSKSLLYIFFIIFGVGLAMSVYAFIYRNPPCGQMEIPEIKQTGWLFIPYIFMVTSFCLALCYFFENKIVKPLLPFFKNVGIMSIEIYLLHGQFIALTRFITNEYGLSKPFLGTIMIIMCFIISWYMHKVNCWMMNKLNTI